MSLQKEDRSKEMFDLFRSLCTYNGHRNFYCKPPIVSNIVSTQDFFVVDKMRERAIHVMKDETLEVALTGEFFLTNSVASFSIRKNIVFEVIRDAREQILIYGGIFPLSICPARNALIYLYFL